MRALWIILALCLGGCLTPGDLTGTADKIDAGMSTPNALRAQAGEASARTGGIIGGLQQGDLVAAAVATITALAGIYANDKRRDKKRILRGEPVKVEKPKPEAPA